MTTRSSSLSFWVGVLLCANTPSLYSQRPQPVVIQVSPTGTECFRDLLYESNLKPLVDFSQIAANPRGTLLISFGRQNWIDNNPQSIQLYLQNGGSVLICSDSETGRGFLTTFSARISGTKITSKNQVDGYKGLAECPYVIPFFLRDLDTDERSPFSIFRSQVFLHGKVAANKPSAIRHAIPLRGQNIEELAGFNKDCQFGDGTPFDSRKDLFAIGGTYGRGRYLILSDPSVFINSMLVREDIQNADFAREVIRWLQKEGELNREGCLFLEDGNPNGKFDSLVVRDPNKKLTKWDQFKFIIDTQFNRILAELQQKDVFNQTLTRQFGFRQIVRGILFVFMGMVLVYGLIWMWNRRFKADATIYEATQVVGRIPKGGVLQQRHQALLESGSLYEAFRQRIRDRFLYLNGAPDHDGSSPRIEIDPRIPDGRIIRKRVLEFWDVAFNRKTMIVKAEDWDAKNAQLRELMRDAEDGVWRFERSSTTT